MKLHRAENYPRRTRRDVFRKKLATTCLNTEINGLNHRYTHETACAVRGKSRISKYAPNLGCMDKTNEYEKLSNKENTRDKTTEKT